MQMLSSKDMKGVVDFFIANINRYFKNDDFEFCLAFIKSPNIEHKRMIASILRKTDCVFEFRDGVVILLSGANKTNSQNLSDELNSFLDSKICECVAYYPYDGDNFEDLMYRLKTLAVNNYKVKLSDEQ